MNSLGDARFLTLSSRRIDDGLDWDTPEVAVKK